ncbi:helix-turn-helix domain-containing protein [Methylobacterium sp. J-076]|uniref:helix-turn-helix domain-containing protein n=1 Tax=Methylobacterium sp. J-076 TaxID=2836655 RepID=UPI001FB9EFC1|nr:helix-turn-helix domain-containing protein [Methylobacterium sp. J-076]MCJ2012251.1 helix-turn-helix domain-containing protein [Methylobacterium sp. J-076]
MSIQTLAFTAQGPEGDGFERYRQLYSIGADVDRTEGPFHARVRIRRFQRMILYERDIGGLAHSRGARRVRHDGFDHFALHLLLSGDFTGGSPGTGHRLRPGEIMVVDTVRPHWTRAERARILTVQLAREVVEVAVGSLHTAHGAILPEAAGGLLADFVTSLVRRADGLPAAAMERAASTAAELLGIGLNVALAAPMARLLSAEAALPLRRTRAEAYVDAHLCDRHLDAEAVAKGIGASRSSLYRAFADDGGLMRYIQRRRLEQLRAALRRVGEGRTVSDLAIACGFADERHCSQVFRDAFGAPPGRYRASIRANRQDHTVEGSAEAVFARWTSELY